MDDAIARSYQVPIEPEFEVENGSIEPHLTKALRSASNGRIKIAVLPDDSVPSALFKQNAIKRACTPNAYKVHTLVAQLGAVRVYVKDERGKAAIVVTREVLSP
jgi:hypothetical protein